MYCLVYISRVFENGLESTCELELWINFSSGLRMGADHVNTKVNYFGRQLCILYPGESPVLSCKYTG